MTAYPLMSFLCPTFNRFPHEAHLLNEKVWWFLQQELHSSCELLIFNDCPGQKLVCHERNVRVINSDYRCPTLGDKMNAMMALAKGQVYMPDEDDDISLPNRSTQALQLYANHKEGSFYWEPCARWYLEKGKDLKYDAANCKHHASVFTRGTFCYPSISKGHDAAVSNWLCPTSQKPLDPSSLAYIYRWGYSRFHLSAQADMEGSYQRYGQAPVEKGKWEIVAERPEVVWTELLWKSDKTGTTHHIGNSI